MELRPYQEEARQAIEKEWASGVKNTLLVLPTGCHAKGSRILKSDGSVELVENLKVGDLLIGTDGKRRKILHVQSGVDYLYKVTPIKGKPFIVTADHKLSLVRTNEKSRKLYPCDFKDGEIVDVEVKDWLCWSKNKKHIHKLYRSNCIKHFDREDNKKITIDPYFLGILLGDGNVKNSISITTMDEEIVNEIQSQCKKYNMSYKKEQAGKAITYILKSHIIGAKGGKLHQELKALDLRGKGSFDKFVPFDYKTNDFQTRLQVIAGLIDTDGSLSKGNIYDFISASKQLVSDLVFMCRSVGLAAYIHSCVKTSQNNAVGTYYRATISGNLEIIPCRVAHKKAKRRAQKKNHLRTGLKVERLGKGQYFGFTVDGDNRYLLDDFTVTHNCGKTVVFSKVIEDQVKEGKRVLVMAHRGELLDQATDKLHKMTGLTCAVEKADQSCLGTWNRVVVGSVQSLMRPSRLAKFNKDYFDAIIVDEAHHAVSDTYTRVLEHFDQANVLGVTATPERSDMRKLGSLFQSLAYEYSIVQAIKEGYLCKIKAQTVPLKIDMNNVSVTAGDFSANEIGTALDPYLEQIATEMETVCKNRKTVVFLPLIATSQKFKNILINHGFKAVEVNGNSDDREQILKDFSDNKYNVICNSMLLTEGWDCPDVDCIVVLRPTKVRSLYCQMVGRGTRLSPGKEDLLILDFLWLSERHELCRPADIICTDKEVSKKMTENLAESGCPEDIEEAEKEASSDVQAQREEALKAQLEAMKKRKRKLVDPLQFEMSIQAEDLTGYIPSFGWEMAPVSQKQKNALEKFGIFADEIENAGKAALIMDRLQKRRDAGLSTPKQIRFLEGRGFTHVGTWEFTDANNMIARISANNWRIPSGVNPTEYTPKGN